MPGHEEHHRFSAMGTWCHVLVLGGSAGLARDAEDEVRRLEALWTRFDDSSETSAINGAAGEPVRVSDETLTLLRRAALAFETTSGWFDPFLGNEIAREGYDRDFGLLATTGRPVETSGPPPSPRRRDQKPVVIDSGRRLITLGQGIRFDPGGIGKGLAADMVAGLMEASGARGSLVNIGGDMCCRGEPPGELWQIDLDDTIDDQAPPVAMVRMGSGGLCTSSPWRRRWARPDGTCAHHLLDPATGRPAPDHSFTAITVIAPAAWTADALCKAVFLAGPRIGSALLRRHNAGAVVVDAARQVRRL